MALVPSCLGVPIRFPIRHPASSIWMFFNVIAFRLLGLIPQRGHKPHENTECDYHANGETKDIVPRYVEVHTDRSHLTCLSYCSVAISGPRNLNSSFVAGSSGRPRLALSLLWVVSLAPNTLHGNFGLLEHSTKTSRLCGDVGMPGNMENQEWRDAFTLGHMRDG